MNLPLTDTFQLLEYTIIPSLNKIECPSGTQHVEPKAMRVLLLLAEQANGMVSRQQLLNEVWPETYSGDEALTRCISLLRAIFGEKQHNRRFIETIPKAGYRLIVPVTFSDIKEVPVEEETTIKPRKSISPNRSIIAMALIISLVGYLLWTGTLTKNKVNKDLIIHQDHANEDRINQEGRNKDNSNKNSIVPEGSSIAVLAFVNMSDDAANEYFSDGISEEILNTLAQIPNLKVTSRTSAFYFKGKDIILSEVAARLGVKNILEGSVRKSGNRIRITAQLIEAETDTNLWSQTYDRELDDIFIIQDEISNAIVLSLRETLGLKSKITTRNMSNVSIEAHNEYLKGRFYLAKHTQVDIKRALTHFQQAVAFSHSYVQAWLGLGMAHLYSGETSFGNIPDEISNKRALLATQNALKLAPKESDVYTVLALIESARNNWDRSKTYFQKALRLNPNNENALMHYSSLIPYIDISADEQYLTEQAVQLNPMSMSVNKNYALSLAKAGRFAEAEDIVVHMLTIDSYSAVPIGTLGFIRKLQKRYGESAWLYENYVTTKSGKVGFTALIRAGNSLLDLNLGKQAVALTTTSSYGFIGPLFSNQLHQLVLIMRKIFPRFENDNSGFYFLAHAEAMAGNYKNAVNLYKKTTLCKGCMADEGYSYLQVGESNTAQSYLNYRKSILANIEKMGLIHVSNRPPWNFSKEMYTMEIAYLENDIDNAITLLDKAIINGQIIPNQYKSWAMFKELRAHPKWQSILLKSDQLVEKHQNIYNQVKESNATIKDLII